MKKLITIFMATLMALSLVACGSNKVERDPVLSENLTAVLDKIYDTAEVSDDFKGALKYYQTTELDNETISGYIGDVDANVTEALCSAPMMSSIPYELILLRVDENADVEAVKSAIKENANPRKWMCVEAEEVVVENIDNTIMFLMANKSEATPIKEAFMNLAQVK